MSKILDEFAEYAAGEPQRFVDWMMETGRKIEAFKADIASGNIEPIAAKEYRLPFRITK